MPGTSNSRAATTLSNANQILGEASFFNDNDQLRSGGNAYWRTQRIGVSQSILTA